MPTPTDPSLTTLTALHRDLLDAASRRDDHRLTPPERVKGGARARLAEKLVALGVAEAGAVADAEPAWGRAPSGETTGLTLTAAGLVIAGAGGGVDAGAGIDPDPGDASGGPSEPASAPEAESVSTPAEPRSWTKIARVLVLLRGPDGADLQTLVAATGWLPHTTRAALTGLRRKGHAIDTWKREADGRTVYRIPAESPPAPATEPVSVPVTTEAASNETVLNEMAPTASAASN